MSWSYSGDPSSSDRDAVRFLIGDTDTSDQQLSNEEITWLLTDAGSVHGAAIAAARALLAKFARLVDEAVGPYRISLSQRRDAYASLIADLEKRLALRVGTPIAGGISRARKQTVEEDSDRVVPAFTREQFDHPGVDNTADTVDD